MVKIVEKGCRDCTVTLDGSECAVTFPTDYRVFSVMNMSDRDIVMSIESGRAAEDDGVRIVEAGGCGMLAHMRSDINTVYIRGTGKVQISAGNEAVIPFKVAAKGGDTPQPEYNYSVNPTVTADTYAGVVTASGNNGYWPNAWMVFDGEVDTGSNRWVGNLGDDSWVQYAFSEAKQLAYIDFNPTVESVGEAYNLTVYGTNDDGATLTQLYDGSKAMGSGFTRIDINADAKFKAFRFKVAKAGEIKIYTKEAIPAPVVTPDDMLTVSGAGDIVQLDGLQGGVPFADISVSGKNLFDYSMSAIPTGIIVTTLTDGSINVSGKMERETAWGINLILKNPLPKGKTYTLSINPDVIGVLPINIYYIGTAKENQTFIWNRDENFTVSLNIQPNVDYDFVFRPQLELGTTPTAYEPPITGRELTVNVNGTDYTITPDSNPYKVPNDIRQQDGINNITVSEGELSVTGSLKNCTLKKVWDKLDELATAIIVSNGEI